jgi:hypothetical protein
MAVHMTGSSPARHLARENDSRRRERNIEVLFEPLGTFLYLATAA